MMGIILFTLIPNPQSLSAAPNDIRVVINNVTISENDAAPYLDKNSRTNVPVRVVSENLGAKVDWNPTKKAFQVIGAHAKTKDIITIVGVANNPMVSVNGVNKYLDPNSKDVVVVVKDNRTYVPLRFFSESLGYEVSYKNRVVYINTPGTPVVELPEIPKVDAAGDKYKNGDNPLQFVKDIPKKITQMENSKAGNQSYLGTNGSNIIVKEPNPYEDANKGFLFQIIINGWNIPGRDYPPSGVIKQAETMKTTKQILSLYTSEHEKVYNAFHSFMQTGSDVKERSVSTKDGRTFKFTSENAGSTIRIK